MLSKRQSYAVTQIALLDRFILYRGQLEQTQRLLQKSLGTPLPAFGHSGAFGVAPRGIRRLPTGHR